MTTFVIATRNDHKVREIRALLPDGFNCLTLRDFPSAPVVTEDADTFAGNATKKAVELARWLTSPDSGFNRGHSTDAFVLADDSGLEVDALEGAPGVHSARFAAMETGSDSNSADTDNNAKLLRMLGEVSATKRTARFRCVIALVPLGQGDVRVFDGVCEGKMIMEPRGKNGFGYDPLFVPEGFEKTFAELGDVEKNRISHRANALAKLSVWLKDSAK